MKKKLLLVLLTLALTLSAFALVGCGHTHSFSSDYSFDETHHWKDATCECNVKENYGEHTVNSSGNCSVCEKPINPTTGVLYDISSDGTYAEVIGYTGTSKKVKIADTYNNLPVKSIYREAFKNASITYIEIPNSVTSIGKYAFCYCDSLTSITIENSVTSIGENAFYGCTKLFVEKDNIKYVRANGNDYFLAYNVINKNFSTYTIQNTTKILGYELFDGCSRLSSITIPDSVKSIGSWAFGYCSSLTSITIGSSVTNIGYGAFWGCSSLTSITIPNSVTSIGDEAFYYCAKLFVEKDNIKYVKANGNDYFLAYNVLNTNFSTYTIQNTTKILGYGLFSGCSRLSSITIPNSVTSIGSSAFYYCGSLTSITIPNSVTSIGDYAFDGCSNLTIYCEVESEPSGWSSYWNSSRNFSYRPVYWYSETQPTTSGNYWHYVNGVVTKWE